MIYELVSPLEINSLVEMSNGIVKTSTVELKNRLIGAIADKNGKVFIDKVDKTIRGFLYCSVENLDGDNVLFVHLCVVVPGEKQRLLTNELINQAEKFARSKNIKNLVFMTRRNPKAFERKYKFKLEYYLMTRKVRDENERIIQKQGN